MGEAGHEFFDGGDIRLWIVAASISAPLIILNPGLWPLFCLFGLSMMKIRDTTALFSTRRVKIWARLVGFVIAPFSSALVVIAGTLLIFVDAFTALYRFQHSKFRFYWMRNRRNYKAYLTMTIHHIHYFAYAYSIPILFAATGHLSNSLMGLTFYVGWAAYNAYEKLVKPRWIWFIVGHVVALVALIGLTDSRHLSAIFLWWFLTGLGGGSVYMLHSLVPESGSTVARDMRIAEGLGHTAGILLWGFVALRIGVRATFEVGAAFAFLSLILGFINLYGVRRSKGRLIVYGL
ncbi:MAG: hypothetical protein C7B47_14115 [Sulfobacillus thermosulfidooxidans]|uniref:Uncharacterized protein n=1 Tax=Sulfobacillus thermosulfidooxidans TaxID=28034 RepID=A0A2T2WR75_SULTH|nr:MAG: hypothetical protein C7B47_14115 [Sulfobacillus thermosulfidooxidans]